MAVPAQAEKAGGLRTIALRVAVDEEFREKSEWERTIRQRLRAVSNVYEKEFQIRWEIVDIVPWQSNDSVATIQDLYDDVRSKVSTGSTEVVLGVSAQKPPKSTAEGWSLQLFPTLVVLDLPTTPESEKIAILVHEFAHLFGAWHVEDKTSIMYVAGVTLRFDEQSARVIRLMRGFDFRRGIAGIDPAIALKITESFKEGHAAGEVSPLSSAHNSQGIFFAREGNLEQAITEFEEAICLDANNDAARKNLQSAQEQRRKAAKPK